MKGNPTDLKLLKLIFKLYYDDFADFEVGKRTTKNFVPIDVAMIARKLGVDEDIVFGRLYYHLNEKYGYEKADGKSVSVFCRNLGGDGKHSINFPLMSSILANLEDDALRYRNTIAIALGSLFISGVAIFVSVYNS
ncbi:hypothetical protein L5163_004633 [Vibrio parahaemolyticus]|nr:hypothetical protein [Vibrio parahaemolyticus]